MTLTGENNHQDFDSDSHHDGISNSQYPYSQDEKLDNQNSSQPIKCVRFGSNASCKAASSNSSTSSSMSGYLYLCPTQAQDQHERQNYTRRWCVVGHRSFYLYDTVYDTAPPQQIYRLRDCKLQLCHTVRTIKNNIRQASGEKKLYIFTLNHQDGPLILGASNQIQYNAWIDAIQVELHHIATLEQQQPDPILNQTDGDDFVVNKAKQNKTYRKVLP